MYSNFSRICFITYEETKEGECCQYCQFEIHLIGAIKLTRWLMLILKLYWNG